MDKLHKTKALINVTLHSRIPMRFDNITRKDTFYVQLSTCKAVERLCRWGGGVFMPAEVNSRLVFDESLLGQYQGSSYS